MHGEIAQEDKVATDGLVLVVKALARMAHHRRIDVFQIVAEIVDLAHPGIFVALVSSRDGHLEVLGLIIDRFAEQFALKVAEAREHGLVELLITRCHPPLSSNRFRPKKDGSDSSYK